MKLPVSLACLIFAQVSVCQASYLDDIGYTDLQNELGAATPDGTGVSISQIEARNGGNYRPNVANAAFTGITFTFPDSLNLPTGSSGHATTVGEFLYGNSGMAGGVTDVASYDATTWTNLWLEADTTSAPDPSLGKVQNFSWIGTTGNAVDDAFRLARMDFAINRDGVIAVVGLNNNTGSVPNLMAAGFNSIAVGRSDGLHSYGTTSASLPSLYGLARRKPDLVAPTDTTSWATAIVGAASTLLVETADTISQPNGASPEVIRSVLMAGATKAEFPGWTHSATNPLDAVYGAGELNIYNSYQIMAANEQNGSTAPTSDVASTGWDLGTVSSGASVEYFFDLTQTSSVSIVLTWNIDVVPAANWSSLALTLPNLDLALYEGSVFALGTLVDHSISETENVELLWQPTLGPGRYAFAVSSDSANLFNYGLAWQAIAVPEPGSSVLILLGLAVSLLRRRR